MSLDRMRERAAANLPAHPQAALFRALAEHVAWFPHLSTVNAITGLGLQIAHGGLPELLDWAKTITVERVEIQQISEETGRTNIYVHGSIAGVPVRVWDTDRGDIHRWLPAAERYFDRRTDIELHDLAEYVEAGTVDGIVTGPPR